MKTIAFVVSCVVLVLVPLFGAHWIINRMYVDEGESLLLRYKGPVLVGKRNYASPGSFAQEGEIGVLARLRGPGRHFYCPIWWERKVIPDITIRANEVGIVTCKIGEDLPSGEFLVDGNIGDTKYKGILRKVLVPGTYRINSYGYSVEVVRTQRFDSGTSEKQAGWVEIPTGYVGVVTNLSDNPERGTKKGVSDHVLPPGIYTVNAREQNIDVVEIGYRHSTIKVNKEVDESGRLILEAGDPQIRKSGPETGIHFPSKDGFDIAIDFTAIWGLMPAQAPHAIRTIGNIPAIEQKIVLPQIDSILMNNGSSYQAVQLLVGDDRERYQKDSVEDFHTVLDEKQITLLYGLVNYIFIPAEVRRPIQQSYIADELTLTREQEELTAQQQALLNEAKKQVELATRTVEVQTNKLVATELAEGNRTAEGVRAETTQLVASINKETAELEAEATRILGQAKNEGSKLMEEAKADRFRLAVEAFGSPQAYTTWNFANNLPEVVELDLFYAGEGTLWTNPSEGSNFGIRVNVPAPGSTNTMTTSSSGK